MTLNDLSAQLAELWERNVAPKSPHAKLPPLPEPLRCMLEHRDPANWQYGLDCYGRKGYRRVTCKGCGVFYGYAPPKVKTKQPKKL